MIFLHLEVNILVKKNNQTFGPHTREEIIEFIENGELSPDDFGTLESEENWVPLNNFISSQNPDSESIYDQFEDEDIDYEKLKEWEDVFKDDEDEGDLTEEEAGNTTPNETGSVSSSEQSIYSEANLTDEQGRSYASAPPPLQESEMQTPTAPSDILLPRENEISPMNYLIMKNLLFRLKRKLMHLNLFHPLRHQTQRMPSKMLKRSVKVKQVHLKIVLQVHIKLRV